jgi:hypothetical protein
MLEEAGKQNNPATCIVAGHAELPEPVVAVQYLPDDRFRVQCVAFFIDDRLETSGAGDVLPNLSKSDG